MTVQLLTLTATLNTTMHSVTDGQTDRQMILWCQEPIILCVSFETLQLLAWCFCPKLTHPHSWT